MKLTLVFVILQLFACAVISRADEVKLVNPDFLDQYAATHRFSLGKPNSIHFAGDKILFLRSGPRSVVQDLFEFDPATGQERVLLTADQILGGKKEELTAEELARRERMRMGSRGISSYSLSEDQTKILVPLSGKLFIVDLATMKSREIPFPAGAFPIDPQLSRDGSKIAAVRDRELCVIDVATGAQSKLTKDATEEISNGEAEFVAQEEMARRSGFWWSPEGDNIAYEQVDTTGVERFHIADPFDPAKPGTVWPYPRAGKKNASVKLGVVASAGGPTTWVNWDRENYPYLVTVKWSKNSPLVILVENREQTQELLLGVDPATGATRELLKETDDAWLDVAQSCPRFLKDGSAFLWLTQRGGAWQLELHNATDGKLIDTLNAPDFGLRDIIDVDEERGVVYVSASKDPTQSHVWSLPLHSRDGSPVPLTEKTGHHGVIFSKNHQWQVITSSTKDASSTWTVCKSDGTQAAAIKSVAESPSFVPKFETTHVTEKNFDASIVRPSDFDPKKKYPVIAAVYGGPGGGVVSNARDAYIHTQWLADQGFIVVSVDGRGLQNRDRAWERITKNNFIDIPLDDTIAAIKALGEKFPEMDMDRVGVSGWSFGGYFTAMAVCRHPEFFKCGVAGAPVVDFADYDTFYTERFLGLPDKNVDGYRACNVLTYANNLSVPLLIIHGTADDNVYFMNSLKLTDALIRAGKSFEFMPLSGFTHSPRDPEIVKGIELRSVGFFKKNLGDPK